MWESIQDMGEVDRISRYRCLGCGVFLAAGDASREANRLQATAANPSGVTNAAA
jgi:hypothetical protein